MKIALLAHLKHPIGQPFAGGLEMHTHLLTRVLGARGHAVTLFCASGSDPALRAVELCPPTGESHGDPEHEAAIDAAENAAYAAMLDVVAGGGFDLVHNNSLHDLPLRMSASLPAPMVTVLHTPPFEPLAAGVEAARSRFAAVSQTLAAQWRDIVPDAQVIGNGIDLVAFPFGPAAEPSRFRKSVPRFCARNLRHTENLSGRSVGLPTRARLGAHAIWFGRIVPEKGLHLAIEAARAAGMRLAFAGPRGDAAYWNEAIAPRLGPDLTDLGHLGQVDLAARIGAARVALVTPRWEEPFGLVVAEALACGTPVAGFRRGALPEILDDESGRLARADDVADLARAIREAEHLDRRACRARAESLFDVEVMADRYEALYDEVLAGGVCAKARVPGVPGELDLVGA